jgi:hypothetical protein
VLAHSGLLWAPPFWRDVRAELPSPGRLRRCRAAATRSGAAERRIDIYPRREQSGAQGVPESCTDPPIGAATTTSSSSPSELPTPGPPLAPGSLLPTDRASSPRATRTPYAHQRAPHQPPPAASPESHSRRYAQARPRTTPGQSFKRVTRCAASRTPRATRPARRT